jgi:6-phosphofructokinase 2
MREGTGNTPVATLTLNPTIDVSYMVPRLIADQKVHASQARYDPGGNGINVSRALHELGCGVDSCFIVAGEIGALLQRLLADGAGSLHPVWVDGETRINCTLLQQDPKSQYEVDGVGPRVTEQALDEISETLLHLSDGGWGILTGSIPPGVHRSVYADLTRRLRQRSARAVVDAQSSLLNAALAEHPFLIKPNRYELQMLTGRPLRTVDDLVAEAQALHQEGIEHVCVSLGADGALLATADGTYRACPPDVEVVSTVGAGDSMVAGLVCGLMEGRDPADVLQLGVACGTATATRPGTQIFVRQQMLDLLDRVSVERLA